MKETINYAFMDKVLNEKIVITGHRGYSAKYPENTLLSFYEALTRNVDMLEMDLNLTKDKVLVVCHDNTVDRTTNGSGYIHDLTLAEIKGLDAGGFKNRQFYGLKIPTFEEFLDLVDKWPNILLNVEIKEKTYETVDAAMKILKNHNIINHCVFTCFDALIVEYINDKYGYRTQGFLGSVMHNFHEGSDGTYSKMFAVGLEMKLLTEENIKVIKDNNLQYWAYCADTKEEVLKCQEKKSNLITCNEILPALEIIKHKL